MFAMLLCELVNRKVLTFCLNQYQISHGDLLCPSSSSSLASHSFRLVLSCFDYLSHALFWLFVFQESARKENGSLSCLLNWVPFFYCCMLYITANIQKTDPVCIYILQVYDEFSGIYLILCFFPSLMAFLL